MREYLPNANDVLAIVGLLMIAVGIALVHFPSALIAVGSLLIFAGVVRFAPRRRGR